MHILKILQMPKIILQQGEGGFLLQQLGCVRKILFHLLDTREKEISNIKQQVLGSIGREQNANQHFCHFLYYA